MAGDTPPNAEELYSSAIVTITVGAEPGAKFYIHQSILEANSPFFKAALNKRWSEGKSLEVSLPEDETAVFATYIDWLYQKVICAGFKAKPGTETRDMTEDEHAEEFALLSKLYILAEKIQDDECCDAAMERMIEKSETKDSDGNCWYPTGHTVTRLYNSTLPGAPVRKFLVEVHRAEATSQWIIENSEDNHVEFLTDLVTALLDDRQPDTFLDHYSSRKKQFLKKG
ncbi:hypothetical protein PRZ48_013007 [Zasmidium cellare]|uniref:BTB domain-containing protein n=1 Tax=Zasmidium cellare TaxID=395010 RepID=A0ABR0E2T9_ZASCE|nr:hypothetical protein PRZ48_013007 [Zasmidium cellare]